MVNYSPSLNRTFAALADPTRRAILERLAGGVCCVSELAEPFDMSLPAISKHLRVLEQAGLLAREKDGRIHRCGLASDPLKHAAEWLSAYRRFWDKRFDALDHYLQSTQQQEDSLWPPPHHRQTPPSASHGPSPPRAKKSSKHGRTPKR
ncbi:MAG: ArsR/SmtB family transcription factor [Nitrospiraceae bacterium]